MKKSGLIVIVGLLLILSGCDFLFFEFNDKTEYGQISIHLTDAPFPIEFIEEANVIVTKVELYHESESATSEVITVFEDTGIFNLLELRNGVTATITEVEVPVGNYNTVRLYVAEANILLNDQRTYDVKVPSGEQTGIKVKIEPSINVVSTISSELLLDFDVSKSFVLKGNINELDGIKGFNFKPVIRAVNFTTTGTIAGTVIDISDSLLQNMEVWIEADSIITTAITNVEGIYGMLGIPAGTYSMYATGEGYDTVVHEVVEVIEGNRLIKNFKLNPL